MIKEQLIKKIDDKTIKVGVVGLGYVGLPLAVEKAKAGFETIGFDVQSAKGNGKYQLDLWKANEAVCLSAGIQPQHISVTDVCTCCNPDRLFSHRASGGKRGNLGMFVMLKKER